MFLVDVFRSFSFKDAAMRAKLGTNRQKTLHNLRKNRRSVGLVGAFSRLIAFVV